MLLSSALFCRLASVLAVVLVTNAALFLASCTKSKFTAGLLRCNLFYSCTKLTPSKIIRETTSHCGLSAQEPPRRLGDDAHVHIVSLGKFAPRPKSKAQSSDGEGLGNDGDDGPGNENDEGGDDDE